MIKFDDTRKGGSDKQAKKGLAGSYPSTPTPTAAQAFKLRAVIRGIHWEAGKQLLDLLELSIANDRRYEIARKQAMDIIASSNRHEDAAINAALFAVTPAPQEKES